MRELSLSTEGIAEIEFGEGKIRNFGALVLLQLRQ